MELIIVYFRVFLALPAFSQTKDALACKLVTSFENNPLKGLPTVLGIILYFDPDTGKIKAVCTIHLFSYFLKQTSSNLFEIEFSSPSLSSYEKF